LESSANSHRQQRRKKAALARIWESTTAERAVRNQKKQFEQEGKKKTESCISFQHSQYSLELREGDPEWKKIFPCAATAVSSTLYRKNNLGKEKGEAKTTLLTKKCSSRQWKGGGYRTHDFHKRNTYVGPGKKVPYAEKGKRVQARGRINRPPLRHKSFGGKKGGPHMQRARISLPTELAQIKMAKLT